MRFWVISAFPEIFGSFLNQSLLAKAIQKKILEVHLIHLREYGIGKSKKIDDKPYGGGTGMLLKPEPVVRALEQIPIANAKKILFSPRGEKLNQKKCKELSLQKDIVMICPRYEGIDERISHFVDEEISIGDFVMMGGEVAAMAVVESVGRLIPGVIGDMVAVQEESFESGLLEFSQYTRPYNFKGLMPPEDLISGNHHTISEWKKKNAEEITAKRRSDLFRNYINSSSEKS